MTRMAVVELAVPGSEHSGRVYLEAALLDQVTVAQLEEHLHARFIEPEDVERLGLIEALLRDHRSLEVVVFPGEESPPVYHAYVKVPFEPDTRLFACVLAPEPVVKEMVRESREPVFETATFQVMPADTTPTSMRNALTSWSRRVWPALQPPELTVRPWPIEDVHAGLSPSPDAPKGFIPRNAPALLDASDYPLPEELIA